MQNATAGGDKKNAAPHNLEFSDGFFSSLMMIILSELGDKTFFIAAVREKTCACGVCVCVCVCVCARARARIMWPKLLLFFMGPVRDASRLKGGCALNALVS